MEPLNDFDPDDVVTDVLRGVRLQGTIFCRSILRAPWGVSLRGRDTAAFHFVISGSCRLEVEGLEGATRLAARDLVILPLASPHTVRDSPGSPVHPFEELLAQQRLTGKGDVVHGGSGEPTTVICGGFFLENPHTNPLLASLPPVLHIGAERGRSVPWLGATLNWIESEVDARSPGSEAVTTRLCEILFIEALRDYYAQSEAAESGWLRALADPEIGPALALIHRQPEARWTVGSLARRLAMSRSSFASKFDSLLGEPPLHYITRCRLNKAAGLLRTNNAKVAEIAQLVGYESEAAFSKAFKRLFHTGPGEFRRSAGIVGGRGPTGSAAELAVMTTHPPNPYSQSESPAANRACRFTVARRRSESYSGAARGQHPRSAAAREKGREE
jgi:AraC-like DNA-binding protein